MWDEASELEIGGYLVVDNLSMGTPTIGGIRMLPSLTLLDVCSLARGMTLKSGAANLPHGGGKSGIVAPDRPLSAEEHEQIMRGFARSAQALPASLRARTGCRHQRQRYEDHRH